ncbi:MAG TPA: hypothetical protein ENI62_09535 [Gammaproteobacteria bacterium]|nr:hypothetical protein [Gammaproteobacteria bacterium]
MAQVPVLQEQQTGRLLFSDSLQGMIWRNSTAQRQRRFYRALQDMALPVDYSALLSSFYLPFATWLQVAREQQSEPLVVGICGAQGSGKSTIAHLAAQIIEENHGLRTLVLSLDDFYLTKRRRLQLAAAVHPLFRARGVPGTHDIRLGMATIRRVLTQRPESFASLPLFDKARDDRRAVNHWPSFQGRPDIVLFEGWCVGACPQPEEQLQPALNTLEKEDDTQCIWRLAVNQQLAGPYRQWFAMLNKLVLLQIPDFSWVQVWRGLQEEKLLSARPQRAGHSKFDAYKLQRFIMHYERLTRYILQEMPQRADLVIPIDPAHNPHWPGE